MNWRDFHHYRRIAGLSAVGLAAGFTPAVRAEEFDWFQLNGLPDVSVGVEAEGSAQKTSASGSSSTYDYTSITPLVGLHTSGFIYHPNLLTFDLGGDLGWGWDNMRTSGSGLSQTINESTKLLRYLAQFNLLESKPYNASFFAAQDHSYSDYGSLNTYTVDASRYGGHMNWTAGQLTLNADFGYRDETDTGLTDSSEITDAYFNFLGVDQRQRGQTTLTCQVGDLDNIVNYGEHLNTQDESVGLSDSENFGARGRIRETTGLNYTQSEFSGQQVETVSGNESVTVNHRPKLDSYLTMDFNISQLHPTTSTSLQGTYGVRHQLYESLTSDLEAHGSRQVDSTSGSDSIFNQYGLGLSENYTKRLQSWGRLAMGTGLSANHQDQRFSGNSAVTTFDEPHQLYLPTSANYKPAYLNQPSVVDSSIQVSVAGDTLVYPADYTIVQSGQLTEVRLVSPPSSHLQSLLQTNDNLSVSVTYQSASQNNSSYDTFSGNFQIRLDLFGHFGIYARMNWLDNNAPPQVLTQTLADWVTGADYFLKWFRTGAEFESYDSNYTQYRSFRFYQDFNFNFAASSSLSVDFNQTFYRYPDDGDQSQYQFTGRYDVRFPYSITWYLQGGGSVQEVLGTDEIIGTASSGLNWTRGKLSLRTGYEYNTQSTTTAGLSETFVKNRFFAYLRRSF